MKQISQIIKTCTEIVQGKILGIKAMWVIRKLQSNKLGLAKKLTAQQEVLLRALVQLYLSVVFSSTLVISYIALVGA